MNKVFAAIALKSAIAAAVIAAAPLASAQQWSAEQGNEPVATPFTSSVSREAVRQEAIEARNASKGSFVYGETVDQPIQPFTSTVSRAQVRAEAIEATRLGLFNRYEGQPIVSAAQLERIRVAGQRTGSQDLVAATR